MDTVGDIAHVVFFRIVTGPDGGEHLLADPTMELAHAIDFLAGVAGEGGKAETLAVVVGILASHADKLVPREAETLGIATHILAEQGFVEVVVSRRHRRMDGIE